MRGRVEINLEDVLVLLEDGPHSMGQLAGWLATSVPTVKSALVRLGRAGRVRCVGPQRLWELVPAAGEEFTQPPAIQNRKSPAPRPSLDDDLTPDAQDDAFDADAAAVDDFFEPVRPPVGRPKALPQPRAATATTERMEPWWFGLSREEHQRQGAARAAQNSASQIGRAISPIRGLAR